MCGIIGYVGKSLAVPIVLNGLKKLEYRGYDSAGIAGLYKDNLIVNKKLGRLVNLVSDVKNKVIPVSCAIGHTRWATHGGANLQNCHPHFNLDKTIAVVHNGIIENFDDIKHTILKNQKVWQSQTDTEVFACLFDYFLRKENVDLLTNQKILKALKQSLDTLQGSYAFAILCKPCSDTIFFAKCKSPLVVGKNSSGYFLSSDIMAIADYASEYYILNDYEFGFIDAQNIVLFDAKFNQVDIKFISNKVDFKTANLGNYKHFMAKEIDEGISASVNTITQIEKSKIFDKLPSKLFKNDFDLHICACGTALNAGAYVAQIIEKSLKIPVKIEYASEFRYKTPLISNKSICIFISQSGETADTLGSVELAKTAGAYTISVLNNWGSRMQQLSDFTIPTYAGIEIAVASTKAYLAQISALLKLVEHIAKIKKIALDFDTQKLTLQAKNLDIQYNLDDVVDLIKNEESIYFIGRGLDYTLAQESALKLKEITYIHCEALPAGELKHGSLALINEGTIVICILTQKDLQDKVLNNIYELNSRGAKVILFSPFTKLKTNVFKFVKVPSVNKNLVAFGVMKPLQILAYKTAVALKFDPDKPRNLAKSVTVE